ncbi:hypothetical protein Ddye_008406 [Dipteronia dyeriana]|uniref:RNase H type-1 domain-containing protein n=1 Tax=Dipteronia dyeriana TaxID=168575 RepID=A0AAD9X9H1_9ROSI|nr:hypothetical protein Ddye_008406 [Dipteronia dyeriana]
MRDSGLCIQKILEVYERSSGQQINLQKSKITFSQNVDDKTMANIQSLLGIVDCISQDKYLGLPSMVGHLGEQKLSSEQWQKSIGIGVAIRDDKGKVLSTRSNQLLGNFNSIVGELITLRKSLLLAQFYNILVDLVKCQAISRSGNTLAHKLALLAFSFAREFLWLDSSLVFLFSV